MQWSTSRSGPLTSKNPPSRAYHIDRTASYAFCGDKSRVSKSPSSVAYPQTSFQYSLRGTKIQYIPRLITTERGHVLYRTTYLEFCTHFKRHLLYHIEKCSQHKDVESKHNLRNFEPITQIYLILICNIFIRCLREFLCGGEATAERKRITQALRALPNLFLFPQCTSISKSPNLRTCQY